MEAAAAARGAAGTVSGTQWKPPKSVWKEVRAAAAGQPGARPPPPPPAAAAPPRGSGFNGWAGRGLRAPAPQSDTVNSAPRPGKLSRSRRQGSRAAHLSPPGDETGWRARGPGRRGRAVSEGRGHHSPGRAGVGAAASAGPAACLPAAAGASSGQWARCGDFGLAARGTAGSPDLSPRPEPLGPRPQEGPKAVRLPNLKARRTNPQRALRLPRRGEGRWMLRKCLFRSCILLFPRGPAAGRAPRPGPLVPSTSRLARGARPQVASPAPTCSWTPPPLPPAAHLHWKPSGGTTCFYDLHLKAVTLSCFSSDFQ